MGGFLQNLLMPRPRKANYVEQDPSDVFAPSPTQDDSQVNELGSQLDTALQAKPAGRGTQLLDTLLGPKIGPIVSGSGRRNQELDNLTSRYKLADQANTRQHQAQAEQRQQQEYELNKRNTESLIKSRDDIEQHKDSPIDTKIDEGFNLNNERVLVFRRTNGETYTKTIPEIVQKQSATPQGSLEAQGYNDAKAKNPSLTVEQYHKQYGAAGRGPSQGDNSFEAQAYNEAKAKNPNLTRMDFRKQYGEAGREELTASTRTMIETAPKVKSLANRVVQLLDDGEKGLGPIASRYREFKAGKVGISDPAFTKLRTDVGLLTTALMRMHVGARGGQDIMHHFQDLIDSSKQSPENLKAAIEEINSYADEVMADRGNEGSNSSGAIVPPPGAKIRDYTSLGK